MQLGNIRYQQYDNLSTLLLVFVDDDDDFQDSYQDLVSLYCYGINVP